MLAISMWSEYKYELNIHKVIFMLAIHELEEVFIGDLTKFQIDREEKLKIGHEAIEKLLAPLANGEYLKSIILEFDARETDEAKFAYMCDHLECDLQCKIYDEEGTVDIKDPTNWANIHAPEAFKMLQEGKSWSDMWMTMGQKNYNYDENFLKVSNYALNNKITL